MTEGMAHLIETYQKAKITTAEEYGTTVQALVDHARNNGARALAYRGGTSVVGNGDVVIVYAVYRWDNATPMPRMEVTRVGYVDTDGVAVLAPGHAIKYWQKASIFDAIIIL